MKNLFLLVTLFCGLFSFAQRDMGPKELPANQPIELVDGQYLVNGEEFSNYDIKHHLMNNNPEAYDFYKKAKNKSAMGGFLLGLGGALVVGDVVKGLVSDEDYPGPFTYIGAGLAAVSIPILSGRKKVLQKSLDTYNDSLSKEKTLGSNIEVNILASTNGVGLAVRF